MLNEEKTELLLLSSRYRPSPSVGFVVLEVKQFTSSPVRNLGAIGVILDSSVDMEDHIKKICKT